jgi:NTP pyrophosphatase (non-canonical NTP hydrolase)
MKNLNELAHKIHESNKLRGFDVAQDNIGQSLMLVVGEIGEAMDAHQCGRFAKAEYENINADMEDGVFSFAFGLFIKNTFEDELADIVIRTLDFCAAFGVDIEKMCYDNETIICSNNIGEYLLVVTGQVYSAYWEIECKEENCYAKLESVITAIEHKAKELDINLEKHIELKMRYNETRPYKHGKRY